MGGSGGGSCSRGWGFLTFRYVIALAVQTAGDLDSDAGHVVNHVSVRYCDKLLRRREEVFGNFCTVC